MCSELIYVYSASLVDLLLTPPSLVCFVSLRFLWFFFRPGACMHLLGGRGGGGRTLGTVPSAMAPNHVKNDGLHFGIILDKAGGGTIGWDAMRCDVMGWFSHQS